MEEMMYDWGVEKSFYYDQGRNQATFGLHRWLRCFLIISPAGEG